MRFFSSGKFVNDPFQPSRSLLYEDTKLYNSIRLAGIGDYHIGELGYNEITNPINILGLILCGSMIIIPLTIIYKDKYRHKLVQINSSNPLKFDFLLIVMIILLVGVIVIELGRNGLLWQIPLSSILRNPIKPMMLVAVSLGFLVSYVIFLVRYFVNFKSELLAWLLFVTIIGSSIIYSSRYFDGTGWIGPVSKYWKSQGFNTAFTDSLVTKSMKDIAQFARGAYIADGEPFRFFIFPLMPSQMEFFRYNLPLVVGDQLGSLESEKRYVDYVDKVNGLVISGDNRSAISLMPLRGKYMAILPDANSAVYTGQPHKWGGTRGALTGDPHLFNQTLSNTKGFMRSSEKNNIFINNYTVLPLVSYVDAAVLVQGDFNNLLNLYEFVTPRNNTIIVPIFGDQVNPNDTRSLISSRVVKTVVHNNTNFVSPAETDLYLLSLNDLNNNYHFEKKYLFSSLSPGTIPDDSRKNISIKVTNSTTQLIVKYPTGGNNIASISYVPETRFNLSQFDTLLLSLSSNADNLNYLVSLFDDTGRQTIFRPQKF